MDPWLSLALGHLAVLSVSSYLLGSTPFGLILCRIFGYGDIRKIGSGNIGATNVLRTGNKILAAITLLLDGGKGLFAVLASALIIKEFGAHDFLLVCGLFAILGHCYPVWLKFKGGKGVATTLGVLLAAVPLAGVVACATWLIVALLSKISSLSALAALAVAPVVVFFVYGVPPGVICLLISVLVFWKHRENIKRLLNGTEPKISFKKKD